MRKYRSCTLRSWRSASWISSRWARLCAAFDASLTSSPQESTRTATAFTDAAKLASVMEFTGELLQEISPKFFETTESSPELPPDHLGRTLANALYGAADMKAASLPETEGRELLTAGFATALRLAETCANEVTRTEGASTYATKLLLSTLAIIGTLSTATSHSAENLRLPWRPEEWTDAFVRCLAATGASVATFPLHAAVMKAILTLAKTPTLRPSVRRNRRHLVEALASKVCSPSRSQSELR
jgi:hypothetical protein